MRALISRVAAVVVGGLVTLLAGHFGLEVSPEAAASMTEGLTLLGMGLWLVVYAVGHKLIDKRINPLDAATVPPPGRLP